jgi:hypothetical protein
MEICGCLVSGAKRNCRGNFVAEVDQAIGLIAESPRRWPNGLHGTRKFVLQRFPFAIVYREREAGIQVLAIAHGHRRPGYWKNRL